DQLLNHNGLTEVQDYRVDEEGGFVSMNPKTMDAPRAIRMKLDRPSTTGSIPLCSIYTDPNLDNYTAHNVNNGQIIYFIDNSVKDPFYRPIYDIPFETQKIAYTDPMNSEKPHYALIHQNDKVFNYSPLSSINDSTFHRENLIASQQAKYNQTRITPFY
ncbi:hypothetical protein EBU71_20835, partial [bacterium]|nr:hypothetical protein [Candidatus Elulimicrobium humile]